MLKNTLAALSTIYLLFHLGACSPSTAELDIANPSAAKEEYVTQTEAMHTNTPAPTDTPTPTKTLPPTATLVVRSDRITKLLKNGEISIKTKGRNIEELELEIDNLLEELLDVEIPAGTFFTTQSAGVQNMVVRTTKVLRLESNELAKMVLEVACANIELIIPNNDDDFTVSELPHTAELMHLMPVLDDTELEFDVQQAAIWIISDDADYGDLGRLVSGLGPIKRRLIDEDDAALAMQLIHQAGIDLKNKAIWDDRQKIAEGIEDAELAAWINALASGQIETVTQVAPQLPSLSLTGYVAYVAQRGNNDDIFLIDLAGGEPTKITDHSGQDMDPVWSPDGDRIAFASNRSGKLDIYSMNPDGSGIKRLTYEPEYDITPAWSPDGSQIAFSSFRDGNWEIYLMNADNTYQRNLTNSSEGEVAPTWSPDGRYIAYHSSPPGNLDIYIMGADGSRPQRLTEHSAKDITPAWSPDGSSIAFWSSRDGGWELYVMNADGGNQRRLTLGAHRGNIISRPAWSPDSKWILFSAPFNSSYQIYLIDINGENLTQLTDSSSDKFDPAWWGQ